MRFPDLETNIGPVCNADVQQHRCQPNVEPNGHSDVRPNYEPYFNSNRDSNFQ